MAHSRQTTMNLGPGVLQKQDLPSKKRIDLKPWHGPALLLVFEGHASCFVSFNGQMAKRAREHVHAASAFELKNGEMLSMMRPKPQRAPWWVNFLRTLNPKV